MYYLTHKFYIMSLRRKQLPPLVLEGSYKWSQFNHNMSYYVPISLSHSRFVKSDRKRTKKANFSKPTVSEEAWMLIQSGKGSQPLLPPIGSDYKNSSLIPFSGFRAGHPAVIDVITHKARSYGRPNFSKSLIEDNFYEKWFAQYR